MRMIIAEFYQELKFAERTYGISTPLAKAILLLPIIVFFLYALSLVLPVARDVALWMGEENRPIELMTFGFLFAGRIRGIALARDANSHK